MFFLKINISVSALQRNSVHDEIIFEVISMLLEAEFDGT